MNVSSINVTNDVKILTCTLAAFIMHVNVIKVAEI